MLGADAEAYRALRLEGLRDHPEAFASSFEDEAQRPLAWFADRLDVIHTLGGHGADGTLLGTVGLTIPAETKLRHRGLLVGMFVRPAARGTGLARGLIEAILAHAEGRVEEAILGVTATNTAAIRLYTRAGFVEYARGPRALKVGSTYYGEILMSLLLPLPPAEEGRGEGAPESRIPGPC